MPKRKSKQKEKAENDIILLECILQYIRGT